MISRIPHVVSELFLLCGGLWFIFRWRADFAWTWKPFLHPPPLASIFVMQAMHMLHSRAWMLIYLVCGILLAYSTSTSAWWEHGGSGVVTWTMGRGGLQCGGNKEEGAKTQRGIASHFGGSAPGYWYLSNIVDKNMLSMPPHLGTFVWVKLKIMAVNDTWTSTNNCRHNRLGKCYNNNINLLIVNFIYHNNMHAFQPLKLNLAWRGILDLLSNE